MDADENPANQTDKQQAVNRILDVVARYAPRALVAVSIATAAVTTMAPAQAEASLPAWLFAAGTGVGVNLLSDWIGRLARKDEPDEVIVTRLAEIFPLDALEQLAAADRETVRQLTRLAAWQRQIKAVIDQDYALGQMLLERAEEVGADVAAIRTATDYLREHMATRDDVAGSTHTIMAHFDRRFNEWAGPRPVDRTAEPGFLLVEERRQLTAILTELSQIALDGAGGRLTFLNNNGLGQLVGKLPMNDKAEVFAGELVALAEGAAEALDDPAGLHPLGAMCAGVLRLEDAPRGNRPFLAGLILKYLLIEDEPRAGELRAEFGPPEIVTPWRDIRRGRPARRIKVNPFGKTGRLDSLPDYLVRQPFTTRVIQELRKGVSLSIVGESQMGKSSLLWYLAKNGSALLDQPATEFVYLDMQLLHDDNDFFEALCEELVVPTARGRHFSRALRGRKVVLCLDEIEKMTWDEFTMDLRTQLRGLSDGDGAPLKLVIASREPLTRLFPDAPGQTSPLANLFLMLRVPPFSLTDAHALVDVYLRDTGLSLPTDEVEAAWRDSDNGHPARLQQALKSVFERTHHDRMRLS